MVQEKDIINELNIKYVHNVKYLIRKFEDLVIENKHLNDQVFSLMEKLRVLKLSEKVARRIDNNHILMEFK